MLKNMPGGRVRAIGSTVAVLAMLVALTGCPTSLYGWGANSAGQVGDGTTVDKHAPIALDTDSEHAAWKTIAAGADHNVGVLTDGELWAWGKNNAGQIGDGSTVNHDYPARTGADTKWVTVAVGNDTVMATDS